MKKREGSAIFQESVLSIVNSVGIQCPPFYITFDDNFDASVLKSENAVLKIVCFCVYWREDVIV